MVRVPDGAGKTNAQRAVWIFERFLVCANLMTVACELTTQGVPPRLVQWNRLTESEKARRMEIRAKNASRAGGASSLPVEAKREVLRAYVPGGFRLLPGRRLRAEVCGLTLEGVLPENEPTRPGVKYGGRKRAGRQGPKAG